MSAATNISQPELGALFPGRITEAPGFRTRMGSITRQSFVYFAGTILTAAAGYFFKIYLARALGAEALGLYALGMTIVGFVGLFDTLGLPTAAARFVAAYSAKSESSRLIEFLRSGVVLLVALNVLLGTVILIVGPWLATHFYHSPELGHYFWAFAAIMGLGVLNVFLGQVMGGYKDVARRTLVTHFIGTPTNIAVAVLLISMGFGLSGYLFAQVIAATLVLGLLGFFVSRMTPGLASRKTGWRGLWPVRFERHVVSFSAAAAGMTALQFAFGQADVIVLGHYVSARQVGIYAVAMALVGFVPVALDSVNQIFSPMISELHTAGNRSLLQQLYSTLTKWIVVLTFPLVLTLIFFPRELMSIFGPAFELGAGVLVLGTIGQLFNCSVGSVGYLLLMSGNQKELIRIQATTAALLIGLNLLLIPRMGIMGAAVAVMTSTITTNVWGLISVRRLLNIFPYHTGHLRLLLPAVTTAGCVFVLSRAALAFARPWEVAGIGLILSYAMFLGAISLVAFEDADRELARLAWGRIGRSFRKLAIA
ncbi:MAG TPA: flippase [Terriglobales bacterium]|nr:flippase [Terriglobales bacterium]